MSHQAGLLRYLNAVRRVFEEQKLVEIEVSLDGRTSATIAARRQSQGEGQVSWGRFSDVDGTRASVATNVVVLEMTITQNLTM